MPALDGFAVHDAFGNRAPYIVFVTAHPEHAHRAFDIAAIDYLVKPVTRARFSAALERVRHALRSEATTVASLVDQVRRALPQPAEPHSTRLFVPGGRRDVIVPTGSIDWLGADGAYVRVYEGNRTHVLRDSLAAVLTRLDPRQFVQIHRSAVVNLDRVRETRRSADGGVSLVLIDGSRMNVSRRRSDEVLRSLGRVGRDGAA
jgi:two-component system LytT family response regulator